MRNDTLVRMEGMSALVERLGMVDAERFVALMNRESFDYTEWRRNCFEGVDVRELSRMAMASKEDGGNPDLS